MKRTLIFLTLVCAAAGARADLVMQQQILTPNYTGVATMKVKGAKVRLDLYAGQPQAFSLITDLNTGETITLMHKQKLFLKTPGTPVKQSSPASPAAKIPIPRDTGLNQKVGDYDTELYTWSKADGITGTVWVAKNYPDYARIRADIAMLDKTAMANNDTSPGMSMLPGMMVRSQVTGGGQTIIVALISAREESLSTSLFGIPRDYKELPRLQSVKPAAAPPAAPKSAGGSTPKASWNSTPKAPANPTPGTPANPAGNSTPKAIPW